VAGRDLSEELRYMELQGQRQPWLVDVHNHVIPDEVIDLLRRDPDYGVTVNGDQWAGAHHVPFTVVASFRDPAEKIAELDRYEIGRASCRERVFKRV
jgi:hypothetical protein